MTTRQRNLLILLAIAAAAAIGFLLVGPAERAPSALDAVPARSFLVASVDVEALRASPLGDQLGSLGEAGIAEVKKTCGFDPLARAKELAVCVPEEEAPGEFGVVARADLTAVEVASCAEKLAAERGARTKVVEKAGGFSVVQQEGSDDDRAASRIALRPGGPLIVGAGRWLDAMMETARTGKDRVAGDPTHAALRKSVIGADKPAVVASAILPKALRERLKRQMLGEAADADSNAAMSGVLGVAQAALAFTPGVRGGTAKLVVELRCETAGDCVEVQKLIERKRKAAAGDLRLRLVGLGAVLDNLKVEVEGTTLRATATDDAEDLAGLVGRLAGATGGLGARPAPTDAGAPRPRQDGADAGLLALPSSAGERVLPPSADAGNQGRGKTRAEAGPQ